MLALFALAIYLFKKFVFKPIEDKTSNTDNKTDNNAKVENMVCCQQCKLHLPQSNAITSEKGIFCSKDCEQKFDRQ